MNDQVRLKVGFVKRTIVKWDGDRPEDADFYPDQSKHPKCLEIWEVEGDEPKKCIYKRGRQIWL